MESIDPKMTELWPFLFGHREVLENLAFALIGKLVKISNWLRGPNLVAIDPKFCMVRLALYAYVEIIFGALWAPGPKNTGKVN